MNGFILTTHADHNPLVAALRAEGVDVHRVKWGVTLPSLAGCQAFYGNLFDEIKDWCGLTKLKQQLRQNHVPYVFWNRDAPWNTGIKLRNLWALRLLKPVDIYLAHSLQDKEQFGGEAHYFPNAAQPAYFKDTDPVALRDESTYEYDVAYFGSLGNRKDRNARLRKVFLDELAITLKHRRPGIRLVTIDTSHQFLALDQQLQLIRSSKINLNIGAMCDLPGNPSWGLPERVFGIPAAGGLIVSDQRHHLVDSFPDNLVPAFGTGEECADLIDLLLQDWSSLRILAGRQHEVVMAVHTYQKRARYLLELLAQYHQST